MTLQLDDRGVDLPSSAATRVVIAALERLGRRSGMRPFELVLQDGTRVALGRGNPAFRLYVRSKRGLVALLLRDEMRVGEAYLDGDLDFEGDLLAAFDIRGSLRDRRPLRYLWDNYGEALFFGQQKKDAEWIAEHYDTDPEFYLSFLDDRHHCYSHGYFSRDDEPLEDAIERKLATALEGANVSAGARVLDIGAGWGAFTAFAGKRGVRVTSLTISKPSEAFVKERIRREGLPCEVVREHFLAHAPREPYDAIVNLGVSEHLPDYEATLAQYAKLLRPGGRVFLDACASTRRYPFTAFTRRHIWPGNSTPLVLHEYLEAVSRSPFDLVELVDDRHDYHLTCRRWAERLDRQRHEIVRRWGERHYRRFHIYLWGCAAGFASRKIFAYHFVLRRA